MPRDAKNERDLKKAWEEKIEEGLKNICPTQEQPYGPGPKTVLKSDTEKSINLDKKRIVADPNGFDCFAEISTEKEKEKPQSEIVRIRTLTNRRATLRHRTTTRIEGKQRSDSKQDETVEVGNFKAHFKRGADGQTCMIELAELTQGEQFPKFRNEGGTWVPDTD